MKRLAAMFVGLATVLALAAPYASAASLFPPGGFRLPAATGTHCMRSPSTAIRTKNPTC